MKGGSWSRTWRSWWAAAVTVICVPTAIIFQELHESTNGAAPSRHYWLGISVLAAVVAAVAPSVDTALRSRYRKDAETKIREAREEQVVAINDALDPLVEKLGPLVQAAPEARAGCRDTLINQALNSAAKVIGSGRTRVSYFEADAAVEPYMLKCKDSGGRHGKPRTRFEQGRRDGDFMIDLLSKNETYFCESVKDRPPPGCDASRDRTYETFFSVPAAVGDEAVGFVTVDSPKKGDLKESDIPLARVIATVIAVSVKIAESAGRCVDADGEGEDPRRRGVVAPDE